MINYTDNRIRIEIDGALSKNAKANIKKELETIADETTLKFKVDVDPKAQKEFKESNKNLKEAKKHIDDINKSNKTNLQAQKNKNKLVQEYNTLLKQTQAEIKKSSMAGTDAGKDILGMQPLSTKATEDAIKKKTQALKEGTQATIKHANATNEINRYSEKFSKTMQKNILDIRRLGTEKEKQKAIKLDKEIQQLNAAFQQNGTLTDKQIKRYREINSEFKKMATNARGTGKEAMTLGAMMKEAGQKFMIWMGATSLFFGAIRMIRAMIDEVFNLDAALTELNKVSDLTASEFDNIADRAYRLAEGLARTGTEVINASTEFARAGYDIDQALDLAEKALLLTNVAEGIEDTGEAAGYLIAIMKGFGMEAKNTMHIVDSMNATANNFAISTDSLADILQRTSGTLSQTGTSFEELTALATGAFEVLRKESKVGSGLITISQRLRGMTEDGESITGLMPKLAKQMKEFAGIDIQDVPGELRSTYEILNDLQAVWADLNDEQRALLGESISGLRQAPVLNAILMNWESVAGAVETATDSMGSAYEENEKYMSSLEGKVNMLKSAFSELANNTIESEFVSALLKLTTSLIKLVDNLGILNLAIIGFATYLSAKLIPILIGVNSTLVAFTATTGAAVAVIGALLIIKTVTKAIDEAKYTIDEASESMKENTTRIKDETKEVKKLKDEFVLLSEKAEELGDITDLTNDEQIRLKDIQIELNEALKDTNVSVDAQTKSLEENLTALKNLNEYEAEQWVAVNKSNVLAAQQMMQGEGDITLPSSGMNFASKAELRKILYRLGIKVDPYTLNEVIYDDLETVVNQAFKAMQNYDINEGSTVTFNLLKEFYQDVNSKLKKSREILDLQETYNDILNPTYDQQSAIDEAKNRKRIDNTADNIQAQIEATKNQIEEMIEGGITTSGFEFPGLDKYLFSDLSHDLALGVIDEDEFAQAIKIALDTVKDKVSDLPSDLRSEFTDSDFYRKLELEDKKQRDRQAAERKAENADTNKNKETEIAKEKELLALKEEITKMMNAQNISLEERRNLLQRTQDAMEIFNLKGEDAVENLMQQKSLLYDINEELHKENENRRKIIKEGINELTDKYGVIVSYNEDVNELNLDRADLDRFSIEQLETILSDWEDLVELNEKNKDNSQENRDNLIIIGKILDDIKQKNQDVIDEEIKGLNTLLNNSKQREEAMQNLIDLTIQYIQHEQKAIIKGLEDEINLRRDSTNEMKSQLRLTKELDDFNKRRKDVQKNIKQLESDILTLSLDDSSEANAQRLQMQEELNTELENLSEMQADREYQLQIQALDDEQSEFEKTQQAKIDSINEYLSQSGRLYEDAVERINQAMESESGELYNQLVSWNETYGTSIEDDIKNAWDAANTALKEHIRLYGQANIGEAVRSESNIQKDTQQDIDKYEDETPREIIRKMKENSDAWHIAHQKGDADEKARLERQNVQLASELDPTYYRDPLGVWYTNENKDKVLYNQFGKGSYVDSPQMALVGDNSEFIVPEKGIMDFASEIQRAVTNNYRASNFTESNNGSTLQIENLLRVDGNVDKDVLKNLDQVTDRVVDKLTEAFRIKGIKKPMGTLAHL